MALMPILPPEIFDEAIDHLWDDPQALEACSLTCRSWVPSSRLHLFRTVRVRNTEDCTSLSSLLESSPVIARCVRKFTICADFAGFDADGRAVEDDAWVNDASGLLKKLTWVNSLALSRVSWSSFHSETKLAFAELFKTVKSLFLFEVKFDASGDVLDFLSAFPELTELYFHAVSWTHESPSSQLWTPRMDREEGRMHLSHLFLDPRSSPTLVTEWLLNHPSEQRLRNIQLCWCEIENSKALGDLLQASGSALEHLTIEFPFGLSEESLLQNQLTLAYNTGLRSLDFGGLDASIDASRTFLTNRLFPWVAVMLAQIRSQLLREVTFELKVPDVSDLQLLDWVRIDQELARREFEGLVVRFYVNCLRRERGSTLETEVRKEIEARLPEFRERGILKISCI